MEDETTHFSYIAINILKAIQDTTINGEQNINKKMDGHFTQDPEKPNTEYRQ